MTVDKGPCLITSPTNPVNRLALLPLWVILSTDVARSNEAAAPDPWTEQKIENAFHDVLAHGDLSDIGFLQKTLGLTFELAQWQKPSQSQKAPIGNYALASEVPPYIRPYGISYALIARTEENTTLIRIRFQFQPCRGLRTWGKDWNQPVKIDDSMDPHGAASFHTEAMRWHQDEHEIALSVTTGVGCDVQVEQIKQGAFSLPIPSRPLPGPGTELLNQVIDLVASGDLRDFQTTARILHTEMSTDGELHGHNLYHGSAIPQRLIPGTNSGTFIYYANDTGWTNMSTFFYVPPQPGPRIVQLMIPVDTLTNCIPSKSLEARLHQRRIHFREKSEQNIGLGPYLQTFQLGNALRIRPDMQGSCIQTFYLAQETDYVHSPR